MAWLAGARDGGIEFMSIDRGLAVAVRLLIGKEAAMSLASRHLDGRKPNRNAAGICSPPYEGRFSPEFC